MLRVYKSLIKTFTSKIEFSRSYPHVCIIGSGPAGFYTAQQVLRGHPDAFVDLYEKLPVPFGLVRYGVAPDHPDVKNCINSFTETAKNERFSFFGNISVGNDVTLKQLKESYHAVVLAYGAAKDRLLNIPGEDLANVIPARRFVGWYNGLPEDASLEIDLDVEDAVVIGQGNVAVDVARLLLSPIDTLKKTDIPEVVLERLSKSRIKRVTLVGRRRPQDAAFTIKEIREMINLQDCRPIFNEEDFESLSSVIPNTGRPRKRLLQLLHKSCFEASPSQIEMWQKAAREWRLRFLLSPMEILPNAEGTKLEGIKCCINRIENEKAIGTDDTEVLKCGLVFRSIGYSSFQIDSSIPFNEQDGIIPNEIGRVTGHEGLYVSGWLATGPIGVILTTMQSGFTTGTSIVSDLKALENRECTKAGKKAIIQILAEKKICPVSFSDWSSLDKFEIGEGKRYGKPREKIVDINKMMEVVHKDHSL